MIGTFHNREESSRSISRCRVLIGPGDHMTLSDKGTLAVQSFRIGGGDSIKCVLAADPRSDIPGQEMMIGMCVRRAEVSSTLWTFLCTPR